MLVLYDIDRWKRPSLQHSHQKASLVGAVGAKPANLLRVPANTHKSHTHNSSNACVLWIFEVMHSDSDDGLLNQWAAPAQNKRWWFGSVLCGWFGVRCGTKFKTIRELVHCFDSIYFGLLYVSGVWVTKISNYDSIGTTTLVHLVLAFLSESLSLRKIWRLALLFTGWWDSSQADC